MPDFALYFLVMSVLIFMAMFLLCWRRRSFSNQESDGNIDVHHLPPAFPSTIFPRTSGVHHKELIDALPVIVFMSEDDQPIAFGSECAVCLGTIEDKELLHLLPKCKHCFHMECIDKWLESHSSCPICRQNVDADDILQMVV